MWFARAVIAWGLARHPSVTGEQLGDFFGHGVGFKKKFLSSLDFLGFGSPCFLFYLLNCLHLNP